MKERDIQRAILDYLAAKKVFAIRMNTGAMHAEHNGKRRFLKFGVPGCADILAFPEAIMRDWKHYTQPLWIECKAPKGKQSELQKSFQQQVEAEGHKYLIARSLDDVIAVIG